MREYQTKFMTYVNRELTPLSEIAEKMNIPLEQAEGMADYFEKEGVLRIVKWKPDKSSSEHCYQVTLPIRRKRPLLDKTKDFFSLLGIISAIILGILNYKHSQKIDTLEKPKTELEQKLEQIKPA